MMSVAEPVRVEVAKHTVQEDASVSAHEDDAQSFVPGTQEAPEASAEEIPPTQPSPSNNQIDLITPRQALPVYQTPRMNGDAYAAKENKSGTSSPAPKTKGKPSQAPLHAACAARTREGTNQSLSQRSQRRPPPTTSNGTPAANVSSTSARRAPPTTEASKPAATTTTIPLTTRANNNGSTSIFLRRPRFVDPMATTSTPSNPSPATPPPTPSVDSAQRTTKPARPAGLAPLTSAGPLSSNPSTYTPPASHATLYISSAPHRNPMRTAQRTLASSDSTLSDAHHRRRLVNNAHPAASAVGGGTPHRGNDNGAANGFAAISLELLKLNNNSTSAAGPAPAQGGSDRSSPLPSQTVDTDVAKADSVRTESEAAVDVHENVEGAVAEAPQTTQTQEGEKSPDNANTTIPTTTATTIFSSKPVPRYADPTRESQVKATQPTVMSRPDKKVILSRPTSNPYSLRMSELTRPSEAYKLSLNSSLHGTALARRSRQPHRVLNVSLTKYPVIRKLADQLGWMMETTEEDLNEYKFNLCWSDTVLSLMRLVRLSNWQRTNHFPSMYLLCRKGHLGTTLGKLRHKLPSHFAFYPRTWSMRSERLQFTQYMTAVRQRRILKYFIMKPNSGCQGRGIVVARDPLTALEEHALDNYIVQEYVHRPLLLEGKKFDLRVYVLLTSIRHPSIFLFDDGLVRICTEQYETPTEENVKNACKHLTNYAVNKKSSDYVFNTDVEHMDVGNKRNFAFLNRWLEDSGYSSTELWDQVGMIVVKTILAAQPTIARVYDSCFPTGYNDGYCCFEVLGFDILIDHKMKPWLMEVNHTPSFATETPLDMDIKSKLLTEVWNIIDCKATDYEKDRQRERDEFMKRNMPPWSSNHPLYGSQLSQVNARHGATDDVESPVGSPVSGTRNDPTEIPPYVYTRRRHEDSKLHHFKRIYPSENEEIQRMYDTIQSLALAESANSRLYYNSTMAAPMPPSTSAVNAGPTSVRSNNPLPMRTRPSTLGPLITTTRLNNGISSPSTTMPPRNFTSPVSPSPTATLAPPNGAPPTISVSSIPTLTVMRDSHQYPSASTVVAVAGGVSATSPPVMSPVGSRGEPPSTKARIQVASLSSNNSTARSSITPSDNNNNNATTTPASPVPPLSSATLAAAEADGMQRDGGRASNGTTPKMPTTPAAATTGEKSPAHEVRVFTPRISSPPVNSRNTTPASTPYAAAATAKNNPSNGPTTTSTAAAAAAGSKPSAEMPTVKPRVAEVHRRATSHPTVASLNASVLHELTTEEQLNQFTPVFTASVAETTTTTTTTPTSVSLQPRKGTPLATDKADSTPSTNGFSNIYHQNGSVVTPPAGTDAQKRQTSGPIIRITRTSVGRPKSPPMESSPANNGESQPPTSSIAKRLSLSIGSNGREIAVNAPAATALPHRQKPRDREGSSMSTHPEPTEEELARLVALQAQIDYESAADPEPDDEADDYNLTE